MAMVLTKRRAWVSAFRLHTLPLAACSILLGNMLAYPEHHFNVFILLLSLGTAICLQILSNVANDYGDTKHGADTDARVGPERMAQQGLISMGELKRGIIIFIILSLACGLSLIWMSIPNIGTTAAFVLFFIGLAAIAAAIAYTATDKPYGYGGWGDLSVFIFFGIIGVFGSYYLQTGYLNPEVLLPAGGIGLFSAGVLNVNNIRDIESDADAGKKTMAVRLGIDNAKAYHWGLLFSGIMLFLLYSFIHFHHGFRFLFLLPSIMFIINGIGISRSKHATEVVPYLKQLVISTLIFTVSYIIGLVI